MTYWYNQIVGLMEMKTIEMRTEDSFRSAVSPVADKNKGRETTDQSRVDVGTLIGNIYGVNQNLMITIEGRLTKLLPVTQIIKVFWHNPG